MASRDIILAIRNHDMPLEISGLNMTKTILESICGESNDAQDVEPYDGTLGVTREFVSVHEPPIGQLNWNRNLRSLYRDPGNVIGKWWTSGTMISSDIFLTAGHSFDVYAGGFKVPRINGTDDPIPPSEIAKNMHIKFNYQLDANGNERPTQSFSIVDLVEYRTGNLDYAIVKVDGNPGSIYGYTGISSADAAVGDIVCIIGHPSGLPKMIDAGPVSDLHDDKIGYGTIDTLEGNSGSGILLSSNGKLVGVHTDGGCDPSSIGHNHGVRISALLNVSPILQHLSEGT